MTQIEEKVYFGHLSPIFFFVSKNKETLKNADITAFLKV